VRPAITARAAPKTKTRSFDLKDIGRTSATLYCNRQTRGKQTVSY
jgi:hypothetical protein